MNFVSISESDIYNAVSTIRAQVQDKYDWAKRAGRTDWLTPIEGYGNMMTKLQIHMNQVFPSSKRELRLKVAETILGIEDLEITSFKDLFPSEISPLIGAFEEINGFRLALDAIAMDTERWHKQLRAIVPLIRPAVATVDEPPKAKTDTWETETWSRSAPVVEDEW